MHLAMTFKKPINPISPLSQVRYFPDKKKFLIIKVEEWVDLSEITETLNLSLRKISVLIILKELIILSYNSILLIIDTRLKTSCERLNLFWL